MKTIIVEQETYEKIKEHFSEFSKEIRTLCSGRTNEIWLDNQEVCQMLNISKRTLQYYRKKKLLPYSQIGYKYYHKRSDVEKLISDSLINSKQPWM